MKGREPDLVCEEAVDGSLWLADRSLAGSDPRALVRLVVGRDPGDLFLRFEERAQGAVTLSARDLVAEGAAGADLEVRYGEVLGLGGLLGQGQEETLLALYGDLPRRGELRIGGATRARRSPIRANQEGIAYVPADRKREALLLPLSIRFNLVLPSLRGLAWRGFRRLAAEAQSAATSIRDFEIRTGDPSRPTQVRSGGNQLEDRHRALPAAQPRFMPRPGGSMPEWLCDALAGETPTAPPRCCRW